MSGFSDKPETKKGTYGECLIVKSTESQLFWKEIGYVKNSILKPVIDDSHPKDGIFELKTGLTVNFDVKTKSVMGFGTTGFNLEQLVGYAQNRLKHLECYQDIPFLLIHCDEELKLVSAVTLEDALSNYFMIRGKDVWIHSPKGLVCCDDSEEVVLKKFLAFVKEKFMGNYWRKTWSCALGSHFYLFDIIDNDADVLRAFSERSEVMHSWKMQYLRDNGRLTSNDIKYLVENTPFGKLDIVQKDYLLQPMYVNEFKKAYTVDAFENAKTQISAVRKDYGIPDGKFFLDYDLSGIEKNYNSNKRNLDSTNRLRFPSKYKIFGSGGVPLDFRIGKREKLIRLHPEKSAEKKIKDWLEKEKQEFGEQGLLSLNM